MQWTPLNRIISGPSRLIYLRRRILIQRNNSVKANVLIFIILSG